MIPLRHLIIRVLLLFFGSIMLLFGAFDLMAPRARYVTSTPAPGSDLAAVPPFVTVSFTDELAPESTITVASTITVLPSGERVYSEGKKFTATGPDPTDPHHRTLRAVLEPGLSGGLYWVEWTAVAARGKSKRFGKFSFEAAMRMPPETERGEGRGLWERDYKWRASRAALVGGVLLVALGALLPRMRRRA